MPQEWELPTWTALEHAVRDHIAAATDGGFLTDWVLSAAAADPGDANLTQYVTASSDGPPHTRLGLVERLRLRTQQLFTDDD